MVVVAGAAQWADATAGGGAVLGAALSNAPSPNGMCCCSDCIRSAAAPGLTWPAATACGSIARAVEMAIAGSLGGGVVGAAAPMMIDPMRESSTERAELPPRPLCGACAGTSPRSNGANAWTRCAAVSG